MSGHSELIYSNTILNPIFFNIYVKLLGEVIQKFGLCCHQYAKGTSSQFYLMV